MTNSVTTYLDASAAYKLLVEEAESEALARHFTASVPNPGFVSSMLLHTELYCAAARQSALSTDNIRDVLEAVTLVRVTNDDLVRAASSSWRLRTLDAIHLATAVRLGADEIVSYDDELNAAAESIGIRVVSPS